MNERAYTKTARKKMDAIEREIRKIEERRRLLGRRLEEVAAGQSPIKPGSIITWDSGNTKRRGRVISVQSNAVYFWLAIWGLVEWRKDGAK